MASVSLLKTSPVLDKSDFVKGQSLRLSSVSSVRCLPSASSSLTVRAASPYADELVKTAKTVASPGRGILAMDESNATCGKRLASIGLENTEANRQAFRTLLISVPGLGQYVSGAILFEETLYQSTVDGKKMVDVLIEQGIVPGIKVDKGLVPLPGSNAESWCQGLDGLDSRSAAYYQQGARFAKWRTVVSIPNGPSALAVKEAAWGLARYAAVTQENGLVPIVEPEILLDGEHGIDRTFEVATKVWAEVFFNLAENNVLFEGILLKPSMVTPGAECKERASAQQVADYTLRLLYSRVPPAVPGIMELELDSLIGYAFQSADSHRGAYSDNADIRDGVCPFYCDFDGYQDELLWGAAWLRRATQDESYLNYVSSNAHTLGADDNINEFGWDNKHAGLNVLVSKEVLEGSMYDLQLYKTSADSFMCSLIPESSSSHIEYTPGGLIYKPGGSNLQHATSITFLLLVYANYLDKSSQTVSCGTLTVGPASLRRLAQRQVNYILGENPMGMSYMVGYSLKYPQRIHHRGSSLPSIKNYPQHIACKEGSYYFNSSGPNSNVHVGAIVGGPGEDDVYNDDRADFRKSEPTTYINAPLVGALAYFAANPSPI